MIVKNSKSFYENCEPFKCEFCGRSIYENILFNFNVDKNEKLKDILRGLKDKEAIIKYKPLCLWCECEAKIARKYKIKVEHSYTILNIENIIKD